MRSEVTGCCAATVAAAVNTKSRMVRFTSSTLQGQEIADDVRNLLRSQPAAIRGHRGGKEAELLQIRFEERSQVLAAVQQLHRERVLVHQAAAHGRAAR